MKLFTLIMMTICGSASAVVVSPPSKPWLRLDDAMGQSRINRQGTKIAFSPHNGRGLKIVNLKTMKIYKVTDHQVDRSFFWAPDGFRVFYRYHVRKKSGGFASQVSAYDTAIHKSVKISHFEDRTGILTFDPRDLRFVMMTKKGIHSNRLSFPDNREARWQQALRHVDGRFVVTQQAILYVTDGGLTMKKLIDDGAGIDSFDISPDGQSIVWASKKEGVFVSHKGQTPKLVDYGRDPKWHPFLSQFIFAGARRIGNRTHNYDIKISSTNGKGRFVTNTQTQNERWPVWYKDGRKIYFTRGQTTDLYEMDLL